MELIGEGSERSGVDWFGIKFFSIWWLRFDEFIKLIISDSEEEFELLGSSGGGNEGI